MMIKISGNTIPVKEKLKEFGCHWNYKKKHWELHMDEITPDFEQMLKEHNTYLDWHPNQITALENRPVCCGQKMSRGEYCYKGEIHDGVIICKICGKLPRDYKWYEKSKE